MTERSIVATQGAPDAIGPYSQAVVAGGLVFCSGQVAFDPATMKIVEGGIRAETERCIRNLSAVLAAAGSSLDQALRLTVYLADMGEFGAMNEVYGTFFGAEPPARVTIEAARLPKDVAVEIDCIARVANRA